MPPVGFEPIISAGELPQTHDLERVVTGIKISVDIRIITGYQNIPQHDIKELHKPATLGTAQVLRNVLM
jgi:hypothetical protein